MVGKISIGSPPIAGLANGIEMEEETWSLLSTEVLV